MKIDSTGIANSGLQPRETGAAAAGRAGSRDDRAGGSSAVSLKVNTQLIEELKVAASGQPEVDQSRVEAIKQRIESGTYHVDPERLATAFLDLESQIFQ